MDLRRPFDLVRIALLCMSVLFGLAACGDDDPSTPNACAGVECEFGVCDGGECVNAASCEDGEDLCLQGYSCEDNSCEADIACPDEVCARGICRAGACINPPVCQTGQNCLDGFFCGDENTCEADPCSETTCERGVCEVGTGECVNQDFCTSETEDDVCLDGFRCLEGACQSEEAVCNELDCQRGVCSFEDVACIDADTCSSDMECLAGNYCADDNTCQPNLCDANGDCARGVCDPSSGECVDADTCSSETDCVDGVVCISGECTANEEACGVEGCQGNQNCAYDDSTLSATCEESGEGCSQALDCLDDRICNAGACEEPVACEDDAFEPNDADGEETDYSDVNGGLPVDANICGGDVDRFAFDTTEDPDGTGELIFSVDIEDADVGLGTLSLELFDSTGASVGTAVTQDAMGNPTASASITETIDAFNGGVFTGVISDDGDVSTAGVNYSVRFDVVSADAIAACASPSELTAGTAATGNSANGASSGLVTTCGDADGDVPEDVWSFTLAEESLVNLIVAPLSNDPDLTVAIRDVCSQEQSEIECADSRGSGGNETIETILPAGTHYAIVQGDTAGDGGAYAITLEATPTVCSEGFQRCLDAEELEFCDATRTGFDTRTCANGCDEGNDICIPDQGDSCGDAFQVDINNPFNQVLDRSRYQNNYDPGEGACVPDNTGSEATDGPDIVLEATVPGDHVLAVQVEGVDSDDTSIYIVSDCDDLSNTCLAGANEEGTTSLNDELLAWENDTAQEVTVFAIIDARDQSSVGTPRIEAFVAPAACTPNSRRCILDRESQLCNEFGTGYDETTVCEFGCIDDSMDPQFGSCNVPTNQTCETAQVLTPGVPVTQDIDPYTDDYDSPQCGVGSSGTTGQPDAFYVLENLDVGDIVTVNLTGTFDRVLYVVEGCLPGDTLGACVGSQDAATSGTEEVEFVVPTAGDYVMGVSPWSGNTSSGTFTIEATVAPPECTPGGPTSCSSDGTAVISCNELGQEVEYTCGLSGCDPATNLCSDETGESCFDALSLDPNGGSITGQTFDNSANQIEMEGVLGSCSFGSSATDENEFVYSISLLEGDLLTAEFEEENSSPFFEDGKFFLLRDCQDLNTCEGYQGTGDSTIEYFADTDQTVYLVVDASFTTSFDFDLTWTVERPGWNCEPMSRTCVGTNQVDVCSDDGTQQSLESCSNCDAGNCRPDPTVADTCSMNAPNAGSGITVVVEPDDFTDQVNFGSGNSCFSASFGTDGVEAFYQVDLNPFDEVVVSAEQNSTSAWPVVYVLADCMDPTGTSCLDGNTSGSDVETRYRAGAAAETVFVGLDNDGFGTSPQSFMYTIDVVSPECFPSNPISCNADADGLVFCGDDFTDQEYDCGGTCSNDECDTPRGDACFDTIPLGTGTSGNETGNWIGDTNTVNPGTQGGLCEFDDSPDGSDDIYEISLSQDDLLEVTVTSSIDTAQVYILEDCEDADSCSAGGSGDDEGNPAEAAYWTDVDRTVFVVVDRSSDGTGGTYDLSWEITSGAICAPGVTRCADANSLSICNGDGSQAQVVSCAYGCADDTQFGSSCVAETPSSDLCAGAPLITGSATLVGTWGDYNDDLELSLSDCGGNFFGDLDGNESFYLVDVPANATLRASLESSGIVNDPNVFLFRDCADPAGTCLAGDGVNDDVATVEFFTTAAEQIYVGVDSDGGSNSEDWKLDIEILVPDCDPATFVQTCNADDNGFEYCDENGFSQDYLCADDGACTNGRCDNPVGDTCIDPLDGNPSGTSETFVGTLADFTDANDLGTGNACTLSRTIGPDAVYVVDLLVGETLTATAVSDEAEPEDIAIYAATGPCGDPVRDVCVAGSDTFGAVSTDVETFNYTATADETIYVYVDSFYAGTEGDYTLTIDVSSP